MKIQRVEIVTSNFEKTIQFYHETLGFSLLKKNDVLAELEIGNSILVFRNEIEANGHFYHFAFNIYVNMFQKAKQWLSQRVCLLKEDEQDEIDFGGRTQANSCYFEDPSGNIVEFISRRQTSPYADEPEFTLKHIIEISEINLTTENIQEYAKKLSKIGIQVRDNEELSLQHYLNFMGKYEDGSFILLGPPGRRWLFSTKEAVVSPVTIYTSQGIISNQDKKGGR